MNFMMFQIVTAIIGVALVLLAAVSWFSGGHGPLPALIALGGAGWLIASFFPTWLGDKLHIPRQPMRSK